MPHALHPGAIQGKEGIIFCHLATLRIGHAVPCRPEEPVPGGDGREGGGAQHGLLRGLLQREAAQGEPQQVQEYKLAQEVSLNFLSTLDAEFTQPYNFAHLLLTW